MTGRLDVWLDISCLFRTRAEAKRACVGGKIKLNGQRAKPNNTIREGDRLWITRPAGRQQDVIVRTLIDRHVRKADARILYDDVTPALSPAELEQRRLERIYRAAARATGTPDRRQRRTLRGLKEGT